MGHFNMCEKSAALKACSLLVFVYFFILCSKLQAQPTVFGSQLVNGDYATYNLTDKGGFRSLRLQAASSASSGIRNWEFATGVAGSASYITNWRPYNSGLTLSAFDVKIDPAVQAASARYNSNSGGQSGLLPAISSGNFYTINVGENASSNNFMSIIETTFEPQTITNASQAPTNGNIYAQQNVVVTVTVSSNLDAAEQVFIRYTTDGWASSNFVQATGSGTSLSATIPGQPGGTNVQYYVLSTKSTITLSHSDADYQTLELNNNGGINYTYTVNSTYGNLANGIGTCDGKWSNSACWLNGSIPPVGASVTVLENIAFDLSSATLSNLTINTDKVLNVPPGSPNVIQIQNGGTITCNGTFAPNIGIVTFLGAGTINGVIELFDVNISGGVNFGSDALITGTFSINAGGFVHTNPPIYETGSTLRYNSGGTYGRSAEWNVITPFSVTIDNSTTLNLANGFNTERILDGDLLITSGSALTMQAMTGSLTVGGEVTNEGTFTLSSAIGGDLLVGGDFTQNGIFNCNNRSITFNGTNGVQSILGSSATSIDFMFVDNMDGVSLGRAVDIDDKLTLTSGSIRLNGHHLNLAAAATVTTTGTNRVIATGDGMLRKYFGSAGSFTYDVGGASVGCPVELTVNSMTGAGYIGVNVRDSKHPNNSSSTDYLSRYWNVTQDGGISPIDYDITCQYDPTDVSGNETLIFGGKWDGSWTLLGQADVVQNTFTGTGLTSFSSFTGGEETALPISWLAFDAIQREKSVFLTWATATELNNSHFNIQRSTDSRNWQNIGTVQGAGTTLEKQSYTFTDEQPWRGINYYRLQQVDYDGKFEFSNVLSVEFSSDGGPAVQFYPNPVKGEIIFSGLDWEGGAYTVSVADISGKIWLTAKPDGNRLDLGGLPAGTYFLKMQNETGTLLVRELFVKL